MRSNEDAISLPQAARMLSVSHCSLWRYVKRHPGFAYRLDENGPYRIPLRHVQAIKAGRTIKDIAAEARALYAPHMEIA